MLVPVEDVAFSAVEIVLLAGAVMRVFVLIVLLLVVDIVVAVVVVDLFVELLFPSISCHAEHADHSGGSWTFGVCTLLVLFRLRFECKTVLVGVASFG